MNALIPEKEGPWVGSVSQQWWEVVGVGGVARKEQSGLWACAFINASGGGRVWGKRPETKPPRLGFRSAMSNGAGERWWV